MRYMLLIYSNEHATEEMSLEEEDRIKAGHRAVMEETSRRELLKGAEPLEPTRTATTVRIQNGKTLVTDGPFAETMNSLPGTTFLTAKTWTRRWNGRRRFEPHAKTQDTETTMAALRFGRSMVSRRKSAHRKTLDSRRTHATPQAVVRRGRISTGERASLLLRRPDSVGVQQNQSKED